jgi:EAL domain-containing protein (putative c-di-GMP-specific phosphodiesterase class I)
MLHVLDRLKIYKKNKIMCEFKMEEVQQIINNAKLDAYFQKIIRLDDQSEFANEYLNRPINNTGFKNTEEFYSFAASHGLSAKVDIFSFEQIISQVKEPSFIKECFINIHLSTLFSPQWDHLLSRVLHFSKNLKKQVVLEISEREGLADYNRNQVESKIQELRDRGILFAIDDLGMGYSGLTNLTMIKPDYVKIDRNLVDHIDYDPYRQHLIKALVEYWLDLGVIIIAEGIERIEEKNFFRTIGAHLGQGYYFHKPEKIT